MSDALLSTQAGLDRVQAALRETDLDAWLLYEFRGQNWISQRLLGVVGTTRRSFILVPREGEPRGLIHAIEGSHWRHWAGPLQRYAGWAEMEAGLDRLLSGVDRVAMEVSPRDGVPTVDLVPHGIVELVQGTGTTPVSSGDLITTFFSVWSELQLSGHREAAEVVAAVAHRAFEHAAQAVRRGSPTTEGGLSDWIRTALAEDGVGLDMDTHVAIGPCAADPHYAPVGAGETISEGDVLLIDLWGRRSEEDVCADQTWMGFLGKELPPRVQEIWEVVREARDAGVELLQRRSAEGKDVRGFEVDVACRDVIEQAGFGPYFIHRTGHSIDTKLHGSGPNLDNLESRDDRLLVPGVGFSIEPGIYLPGDVGVRSEINVYFGPDGPEVTPREVQREVLLLLAD